HVLLQAAPAVAGQLLRLDVDLDVELAQLGGPVGTRDGLQHLGVAHARAAVGIDDVELDLQTGERAVVLELRLAEQLREDVETPADLLAVPAAVVAAEDDHWHIPAHT